MKFKYLFIGTFFMTFLLHSSTVFGQSDAQKALSQARQYFLTRSYKDAFSLFFDNRFHPDFSAEDARLLGAMYDEGLGTAVDYNESLKWTTIAANQWDMVAQYNMAVRGEMIGGSFNAAIIWYRRSADGGYLPAMHRLGEICFQDHNDKGAVRWFKAAAEKGYAESQVILAYMYEQGLGVQANKQDAEKWREKAAAQRK